MVNKRKKKKFDTLLSTLANGATEDSKALLSANGINDHSNLQGQLANFWNNNADKKAVEKAFAEIHPHRDFILRYNSPIQQAEPTQIEQPMQEQETQVSNCAGKPECNCEKKSGADGIIEAPQPERMQIDYMPMLTLISIVGIIGIIGLIVHKSN